MLELKDNDPHLMMWCSRYFKSNFCRLISTKSKTYEHKSREVFGVAVMRFSLVCFRFPPHSSSVCVVLGRKGSTQTSVNEQDHDGYGRLRQRSSMFCCSVFSCLIGRDTDRRRSGVLRIWGWNWKVWVRICFLGSARNTVKVFIQCVCLFLRSFSVLSFSFQLCSRCRCGTRAAGGSITWV